MYPCNREEVDLCLPEVLHVRFVGLRDIVSTEGLKCHGGYLFRVGECEGRDP